MTDAEYIEKIDTVSTDQLFESLDYYGCDSYYADLWNATISELKKRVTPQSKWIPVSERLPEEGESVLVCLRTQGGISQYVSERFNKNCWSALGGRTPLAWQPLPEPYKKGEEE